MRLTDHVTLNFNNNMSTAAVFLDIEKAFDTTWHPSLLYSLYKLHFSANFIKLITSFLLAKNSELRYKANYPRHDIQAGVLQGSVLAPILYNQYINDVPQTPAVQLALFADDTCIYATDRKEGYVLRKLQRGLNAMEAWCERWNMKINEDKTQSVCFSRSHGPVEARPTLIGRNILFVKVVKYLGVIFYRKITRRFHID